MDSLVSYYNYGYTCLIDDNTYLSFKFQIKKIKQQTRLAVDMDIGQALSLYCTHVRVQDHAHKRIQIKIPIQLGNWDFGDLGLGWPGTRTLDFGLVNL